MQYKVNDMVMAQIQVNSNAYKGVVGKLSIEDRGPFYVVEDYGNSSNSVQLFDKLNIATHKFQAQDMCTLPPQIFPYNDMNLADFWYINSDFASVKHQFKDNFNIES